jgi:hypothetical protein
METGFFRLIPRTLAIGRVKETRPAPDRDRYNGNFYTEKTKPTKLGNHAKIKNLSFLRFLRVNPSLHGSARFSFAK